jgi:hypothetical protein
MNKPTLQCPLCGKKKYSKHQVIACMELDQKEEKAKNRRLIPLKK